ncbi:MAG: hypothetical protein V3W43_01865 [Desulfatiglandaceae bacterium]
MKKRNGMLISTPHFRTELSKGVKIFMEGGDKRQRGFVTVHGFRGSEFGVEWFTENLNHLFVSSEWRKVTLNGEL